MTSTTPDPHLGHDDRTDGGTTGRESSIGTGSDVDTATARPPRPRRQAGEGRGAVGAHDVTPPETPTFASVLCRRHQGWVVDRTRSDRLPTGWRDLLSWAFADLSEVIGREGRFALTRLGGEGGELAVNLEPDQTGPKVGDVCLRAVGVVLSQTVAASWHTCQICGAPGAVKESLGATLCAFHAAERATGGIRSMRPGRRPRKARSDAGDACASPHPDDRIALYDVRDVAAAIGRDGGSEDAPGFAGDPEERRVEEPNTEQTAYLRRILRAGEDARWRGLARPDVEHLAAVGRLARRAPHMGGVLDLVLRHLEAAAVMGTHASIPTLLLLGEPGTGKTWLAERLAEAMGVPVRRHPMNAASVGDGLTGSHPVWRGAWAGLVARTLLAEAVANPVVIVDEVDKAASHNGEDPFRPLYSCLEPVSAGRLTDEFLGFPIDASNVSWLLTANSIDGLPAPIIDRLTVVEVPCPDEVQLRAVAEGVFDEANAARRGFFGPPDGDVLDRLAAASPRRMGHAVVDAMARAASPGAGATERRPAPTAPTARRERRRTAFE